MLYQKTKPQENKQKANFNPLMPFCKTEGTGRQQIVLIHGFGMNHKSWYDISPLLSENATLHMVDLIGCGNSPAPAEWPYTIEAQAGALMDFITRKNLTDIVVVGHSYGGGVALMLFHKMMENSTSTQIKKMILIAPAAYPQTLPFFIAIPRVPFIGEFLLGSANPNLIVKVALRKALGNKLVLTQERIRRYAATMTKPNQKALIRTAQNIIPENAGTLVDKIKGIHALTLLIYGEKERVVSMENLKRLSLELPDCTTKRIAGCGHLPHEEYPKLTAELITDFLHR